MWYDRFQAFKLTPIGNIKVKWAKSYLQCAEGAKSMRRKKQTFMPRPSTWSLKPCHIPTVGRLRWKFFCLSIFLSVFLYGKHYLVVCCWYHSVKKKLCSFHCLCFTMLISVYLSHSVNVTMLILLWWYMISLLIEKKCGWTTFTLKEMTYASTNMTIFTKPFLPATFTWSLKTRYISTTGIAINGRHFLVVWVSGSVTNKTNE